VRPDGLLREKTLFSCKIACYRLRSVSNRSGSCVRASVQFHCIVAVPCSDAPVLRVPGNSCPASGVDCGVGCMYSLRAVRDVRVILSATGV
jgi:hypothetical protein